MATGMTKAERRRAPRIAERVAVSLIDAGTELRAETQNLSVCGAYCTLDHFIAPMTKLHLRMELPSRERTVQIQCTGVVVRVEPVALNAEQGRYHVAIFFTDLSDRSRATISQFVLSRLSATPSTR